MIKAVTFEELWKLHLKWSQNILTRDIVDLNSAILYISPLPGKYWNFAIPKKPKLTDRDLTNIQNEFKKRKTQPTFYLTESLQSFLPKELSTRGYSLNYTDTWMFLEKDESHAPETQNKVTVVRAANYQDFLDLELSVFGDDEENRIYQQMTIDSLSRNLNQKVPDLKSELYLIYEDSKPVASAALFFSVKENIGYLHDGATATEFRGKGCQTDLINYRVKRGMENNITRFYSIAEFESGSWRNLKKLGFAQVQKVEAFVLDKTAKTNPDSKTTTDYLPGKKI